MELGEFSLRMVGVWSLLMEGDGLLVVGGVKMCVIIVMKSIGCDKLFVDGSVGFCCLIEVIGLY